MKKGRHRRYEEARELKHTSDSFDRLFTDNEEPCPECEALPGQDHKGWCMNASAVASAASSDDATDNGDLFPG